MTTGTVRLLRALRTKPDRTYKNLLNAKAIPKAG